MSTVSEARTVIFPAFSEGMEFTGERYIPGIRGQLQLEHLHRYLFASRLCSGSDVLDIACGEGYGANALASTASTVLGVDIDPVAIHHARRTYTAAGLHFVMGSISSIPAPDARFDLVTCFETLEHVAGQQKALAELKRVMRPDGVLLISTPNKDADDGSLHENNPYHEKELSKQELSGMLSENFKNIIIFEQRFLHGTIITKQTNLDEKFELITTTDMANFNVLDGSLGEPYFVAVASDGSIPSMPSLSALDGANDLKRITDDLVYSVNRMHDLERSIEVLQQQIEEERTKSALQAIQILQFRDRLKNLSLTG